MAVEQPCANCCLKIDLTRVTEPVLEVQQCVCAASAVPSVSDIVGCPAKEAL
jgi:hypothetical protein